MTEQRAQELERLIRRLRQRMFDYDEQDGEQALRIICNCKRRLAPLWDADRRTRDARKLERTPSAFEPGLCG